MTLVFGYWREKKGASEGGSALSEARASNF